MKIGVDARQLSCEKTAGIGTYVKKIILFINEYDKENEYFLYTHKPIKTKINLGDNFHIKVIPGKIGTVWLRFLLKETLKKDQIEVFWGTEHVLPKKIDGIKYVLTIHDLALLKHKKWGKWYNVLIQNLFLKKSVKDADRIIAISQCTKKDIEDICEVGENKIDVVYNGGVDKYKQKIDSNKIDEILLNYKIDNKFFFYIGTIEPRKNIETIIKAFEKYENNEKEYLVIAGGLGWKYKKILKKIEYSSVKKNIKLLGYVTNEEKYALFSRTMAFIFPSHYEGFGLPIIEAMSHGVPIITAKNSCLQEIGGDVAYYLEDENDYSGLSKLMKKCSELDKNELININQRGIKRADSFTWEQCAIKTLDILKG